MKIKFKHIKYLTINIIVLLMVCFLNIESAWAVFNLSVTPYERGYELRFEKADQISPVEVEKGVTIAVNTDIGKRYQVVQTLLEPLINEEGAFLPMEAFAVYTLQGSNRLGTMGLDSEVTLRRGRTLIYTSNQAGDNDSFVIVYSLDYSLVSKPGLYRGRLNFSLEPIDSTQEPVMVTLDVEASVEASSKIELKTLSGGKTLELEAPERKALPAEATISIQGQRQGQYRIFQMPEPLMGPEGEELTDGVYFSVEGGKNGVLAQAGETALRQDRRTLLYTSSPRGMDDQIIITYSLKEGLKSARYRGKISYYIEGPFTYPQGGRIDTLQLDVNIKPIFEIKITPETGGLIEFRDVKSGKIQESEVLIEINSNLGRSYQVSQNVLSALINEDGKAIPEGFFKLITKEADGKKEIGAKGVLKYPSKSNVELGETVLFISNNRGDPAGFRVIYELNVPFAQRAGNYTTRINYSLFEIGM